TLKPALEFRLEGAAALPGFGRRHCARRTPMPPADDGEEQSASRQQRSERHHPRQQVETFGGRRRQNLFAVLVSKHGDYLRAPHTLAEHLLNLSAQRHRELALRMVAIRNRKSASALAAECFAD